MKSIFDWLDEVGGVASAAALLDENPRTVASWVYGEKMPKPATAHKITRLTGVDFNGVYAPLFALQEGKRATAMMKKGAKA